MKFLTGPMEQALPTRQEEGLTYIILRTKLKAITDVFTNVDFIKLNRDKTKLLLITNSFTDKMQLKEDLYLYDMKRIL